MRLRRSIILSLSAIVASLAVAGGCTYEYVVSDGWAGMREYADSTVQPASGRLRERPLDGWAIRMASLQGKDAKAQAARAIAYLQKRANVPDLWYLPRADGVEVYRGKYVNPTDPAAQSDLRQTRMLVIDGKRPYEKVELVPLTPGGEARTMHPADLRTHTGMYSLQVAFFDDPAGEGPRAAAEAAVKSLREAGVEAYYYHGPFRSLVTVGLFAYTQAFALGPHGQDEYAEMVLELQQKFPCNLANEISLEAQQRGSQNRMPSSFLVQAP